jgi:hypothetical protein
VHARVSSKSCLAVAGAVACLTAAIAGCSSSSSSSHTASSAAPLSPTQAVLLAAHSAEKVNTFSGTISLQGTLHESGATGPIDIAGTASGQLHPSVLLSENFTTFKAGGENLAPMDEMITTNDLYMKLSVLTQALHTSKPWVEMPLSALSAKSGINLGSLLSQAQNSSPLATVQLLAGASDVKKVGTGTVGGTPVTEYSGTITIAKALDNLPADTRAGFQKAAATTGVKSASFKVWLDASNQARKEVAVEDGTAISETTTVTLTSVNQPVTITPPPASQVTSIPASALSGS